MKNVLMASSAIVGAAALVASPAAAQELAISGFQDFLVSGGDADEDGSDRGFGFSSNTEIHFNGSIMADNGVTFGFRVELEADSGADASTAIDENSVWASGSFGKLEFGNNDGAEDSFMINGTHSGAQFGTIGNPTANFLTSAGIDSRTSTDLRGGLETSDATKITYTTPSFNGFSVGVSYTPDTSCSDGAGTSGGFCDENSTGFHDSIGVGLGYEGDFNGVGLNLGLVGAYASADGEPEDNAYGIGGGMAVSFSGFTIAAGAVWDDFDDGDATGNTGTGWAADLGIGYVAGPWEFSINGLYAEEDDADAEYLAGSANIGYNLTPGVTVFVTGFVGNEEVDDADNDIVAVTSGLRLAF